MRPKKRRGKKKNKKSKEEKLRIQIFDRYDEQGVEASLKDKCRFCAIVHGEEKSTPVMYKDDLCIIFPDILKNRAQAHYQCVPLRHIRNYQKLKISTTDQEP